MAATTCSLSSLRPSKLHLRFVHAASTLQYRRHVHLPRSQCPTYRPSRSTPSLDRAIEGYTLRSKFNGCLCNNRYLFTTAKSLSTDKKGSRDKLTGSQVQVEDEASHDWDTKGPHMHTVHTPDENQKLLVIQPEYKSGHLEKPFVPAAYKLDEAVSLGEAITGWEVHSQRVDSLRQVHNRFLFGKGKVKELQSMVRELGDEITGVFINVPVLSSLQHRTLEELFGVNIFDRFGIVLRIFKERAHTKEAKIQVELAEIPYLKMRFFEQIEEEGGFSHQRGGTGKMGGAGETSVDVMKQKLNKRQKHLRDALKEIRHKHHLSREQRAKHTSMPVVAIVGYTNAGKTSLIKALTHDQSMEPKDMLFATLDSTVHAGKLPCGLKVLFVDTIGFVSDLPHELIESFQTTLEDVVTADVLVNVTDLSHPQFYAQRANVQRVLEQLQLKQGQLNLMINVLNKVDKTSESPLPVTNDSPTSSSDLTLDGGEDAESSKEALEGGFFVSATEGKGLKELQLKIQEEVLKATKQKFFKIVVPVDGPQLSWLHHSDATVGHVGSGGPSEEDGGEESSNELTVHAILSAATLGKFKAKFGDTVTLTETQEHLV